MNIKIKKNVIGCIRRVVHTAHKKERYMRKSRKTLSLLLSAVLAAGMLSGCGNQAVQQENAESKTSESSTAVSDSSSEAGGSDVEIELVCGSAVTLPDENFLEEALAEAVGVKSVTMTILGAGTDYQTALNTRLSGGDIPDVFSIGNKEALVPLVEEGLVLNLDNYREELSTVIEFAGGEETMALDKYEGTWYLLPYKMKRDYSVWNIRQDWLDNLGLSAPTTFEELMDVCVAFTTGDPDGNGKNDTYGLSGAGLAAFNGVMTAAGGATSNLVLIRDGEVTSSLLLADEMKQGLSNAKALVDAGVVDPDIITNDDAALKEKLFQGKAGITTYAWSGINKQMFIDQYKGVNPNANWVAFEPVGENGLPSDISGGQGTWVINAALAEEPEKLSKIFDLLNYIATPEGTNLVSYGIEGRHYNVEDGKIVPTELMSKECDFLWVYQMFNRNDEEYLSVKFPEAAQSIAMNYSQDVYGFYNNAVIVPDGFYKADMDRYVSDNLTAFIYGERPIDEYEDFLQELEDLFQFESVYMESAKQQLQESGYLD